MAIRQHFSDELNWLHVALEERCTVLLATEQPVASDLRDILTAIKITAHLERIGDHAGHLARSAGRDDTLDRMKNQHFDRILELMQKYPGALRPGADLLFVNRFLERLGDHVTNMCEWIVYSKRGEHVELNK